MYPVSDLFKETVKKSHITTVKVEIFDVANGTIISTAQPISGSVSIDSRRSIRRDCSLEFVDADGTFSAESSMCSICLDPLLTRPSMDGPFTVGFSVQVP